MRTVGGHNLHLMSSQSSPHELNAVRCVPLQDWQQVLAVLQCQPADEIETLQSKPLIYLSSVDTMP